MRLAHHPEVRKALRKPTAASPWRVLISGCLYGLQCGVSGDDYGMPSHQPPWLKEKPIKLFPFCPEDAHLGTPRGMPDLHGGDGFDVLDGKARMLDEKGNDITQEMIAGAKDMLAYGKKEQVDFTLLVDRSGACGSQVVSLGCRFQEPVVYIRGVGLAAATLLRGGIPVVSQRDFFTLGKLGQQLDPSHAPAEDAVDHHNHPWVKKHLPLV